MFTPISRLLAPTRFDSIIVTLQACEDDFALTGLEAVDEERLFIWTLRGLQDRVVVRRLLPRLV